MKGRQIVLNYQCDELAVSVVRVEQREWSESHAHNYAEICTVLQGAVRERSPDAPDGRTYFGDTVELRPAGLVHSHRVDSSSACVALIVELKAALCPRLFAGSQVESIARITFASPLATLLRMLESSVGEVEVRSAAFSFTAAVIRQAAYDESGMYESMREIARRPRRTPLTINDLARELAISPSHAARTFRRVFGVTLSAYERARRIEAAARALVSSDARIADIALDHGFYDQPHFTRQFRREHGMTPDAYRRESGTR